MGPELIWLVCLDCLAISFAACLYAIGGTSGFNKMFRRLGSAISLGLALNITAIVVGRWAWQYAAVPAILFGCYTEPYGGDKLLEKIFLRSVFAISFVGCYLLCLWATGFTGSGWLVFSLSSVLAFFSVPFGVLNPFSNAPVEQALICFVTSLFLVFWPFVK